MTTKSLYYKEIKEAPLCSSMASGLITASVRCLGKKKLISRSASSGLKLPWSWLTGSLSTANWALRLTSVEYVKENKCDPALLGALINVMFCCSPLGLAIECES